MSPQIIALAGRQELPEFFAEYVINNITHLPEMYSTAGFWNAHSHEFLALRVYRP